MAAGDQMMLGDVVRFGNGKAIKPGGTGLYPVFGSNGIIGGSDEFRHENGVVIGRVGAYCGAVLYCPSKFWASDNTLVAYPASEQVDTKFLYYLLVDAKLSRYAGGAAQPLVTQTVLKQVKVCVPPLSIQQRIAGILSAYDELIENSQRRIKILESMARALYREWFVHFRFPGHENHPRVASPLGEIPQGWEVKTVEEIVKRIPVGKKYDQKTVNPTGAVPVFDQGKSGVIGYHDDQPGVEATENVPVIVFANHTCYQRLVHFPFSAIQNVLPFIPHPSVARNIYWLHWATNGLVVFNDYKGHWPEFAAQQLVVPSREICQQFSEFAAPISRQTLKLERQIQNLRRTRDLLLPRLLSGQIDVQPI
jgi:type I restriction enzyme S subunit